MCTRRELLAAVVVSSEHFRRYLLGKQFFIRTDHALLIWLLSFREFEGQLARWVGKLDRFDYKIIYRAGKSHGNADGLSRRPCSDFSCKYCSRIEEKCEGKSEKEVCRIVFEDNMPSEWREAQQQYETISFILRNKESGTKPNWQDISSKDEFTKVYCSQWESLVVNKLWYQNEKSVRF